MGELVVERWLYRDRSDPASRSVVAMDLRLGIVEAFRTQHAAEQASWVVSQLTPG